MNAVQGRWVRYGTDAAEALRRAISEAKGGEPLAPVTVVVPSNQVGVSARRLLASGDVGPVCGAGPGLIGVTFVTPYRLAELLGAAALASAGRRPVSTPVLGAAVRRALAAEPGSFEAVAQHAATESALVDAYRELRDVAPAALDALAAAGERAGEVVRLHRAARAVLEAEWYDEEDLMASATEAVRAGHAPPDLGALIIHLPQRLSRHAAELLRALTAVAPTTVLAGTTGVAKADAEVRQAVERLEVASVLGPPPEVSPLADVVDADRSRITTASDADDEVRHAVRVVLDAARAGLPLDRVAVLYAAREPYARLLQHHLDAAEIPTNGSATLPLSGRLAGRTLLDLLSLPTTGWRRQDLFAWLTGAPILHQGRWAPTTAWERISREAGVVAGRADWDVQLEHLAVALEVRAAEIEAGLEGADDPGAWRAESKRADAARARALRSFVLELADRLAAAEAPAAWSERSRWAKQLVADVLGGPARRTRWPDPERRAAERLDLALDRLAVLDEVEGPVGIDVFTRALAVELEADLGRTGRFGEGVLVGPVSMGVGLDLRLVILVGMAEGTFPSPVRDDSLLPDEDREQASGSLPLRSGHVDRLLHQFLAVIGGARRHELCIPKGDLRRSRERVPSRWVLDVASELAGTTWWSADLLAGAAPWLTHLPSFDAALRAAEPATDQEHRLRRLLASGTTRRTLAANATTVDPEGPLRAGADTITARWSTELTRFDGNLTGLDVPSPTERGASATSLESWARCPHAYFLQHVLGIRRVEQPEDALQITAIDRGELVHEALESFIREAIDTGAVPAPGTPWSPEQHERLRAIGEERCDRAEADGLTGRPLFWRRDRTKILADLDRFLHKDDALRAAHRSRPIAAELAFGIEGTDPVPFPLTDGRTIPLRGKADRIDQADDGTLWVLDYKTGNPDKFKKLSAADPHQGGQRLQLAVYAEAARQATDHPDAPVSAAYWFTSDRGQWKTYGYDVDDKVLLSVSEAATAIVEGIEGGLFAPNPPEQSTGLWPECPWCDPDGLGTAEIRRQMDRKLEAPALAPYRTLTDPPVEPPVDPPVDGDTDREVAP